LKWSVEIFGRSGDAMWVTVHVRGLKEELPVTFADGPTEGEGSVAEKTLRLFVLEATRLRQLRDLVALQLASHGSGGNVPGCPSRPSTAPARSGGSVAASLAAASGPDGASDSVSRQSPTPREALASRLVFDGVLSGADAERGLRELGLDDGAVVHCGVDRVPAEAQQLLCFPRSCSTDGGRVVRVAGERFPASNRTLCCFGTIAVMAEVEDDGDESGVAQLRCVAPPHPAGPVTLRVSLDAGSTWMDGPTFMYVNPESGSCTRGIPVPSSCCGVRQGVSVSTFGSWTTRWDNDDRGNGGAGCA